jgi:hypothetical protein
VTMVNADDELSDSIWHMQNYLSSGAR